MPAHETLLGVFVGMALVNNIVLAQFLGLCPFLGVSRRMDAALGLSAATVVVLTFTSLLCYVLYEYVLQPLDLGYLRLVVFILTIAASVQIAEVVLRRLRPTLHAQLGIYLPLITTNCAVLAVALLSSDEALGLAMTTARAVGAASGFALVMVILTGLRERLQTADVPAALKGTPIALFTIAILTLAFSGFTGFGY